MFLVTRNVFQNDVDIKKLIEMQANQPAFQPMKVVKARKKFNMRTTYNTKRVYPRKMLRK